MFLFCCLCFRGVAIFFTATVLDCLLEKCFLTSSSNWLLLWLISSFIILLVFIIAVNDTTTSRLWLLAQKTTTRLSLPWTTSTSGSLDFKFTCTPTCSFLLGTCWSNFFRGCYCCLVEIGNAAFGGRLLLTWKYSCWLLLVLDLLKCFLGVSSVRVLRLDFSFQLRLLFNSL